MNFDALLGALKYDEDLKLKAYYDTENKLTIGYGFNLERLEVTKEWAADKLTADVINAQRDAADLIPGWLSLDDVRQNVISNMSYNLGKPRLMGFKKFLAAVNARNWPEASAQILDSDAGRKLKRRYGRLAKEMLTGIAEPI